MKRVIIHSDINNCYASIERQLNPSLAGKPIAVCGAAEERHGIVLAKSYEAKAFGVQTGEAIWQAKNKCHNLIIVSPHYDKYVQYSRLAHEIYKKYTPLIEPYGLDECWLDVSGSVELFGSGEEIAAEIHRRFKEELGLTVSCGVASNKIFAKLGSDMKKPDATTVIPEEGFQELVWPLPVSDLWGVGRQTTKKLDSYCINTIGALAKTNLQFLQERFGVAGTQLWLYANGRDTSRVARYGYIAPIKSIGHGATTAKDMESDEEVWRTILDLTQEIGYKLKKNHLAARGIQINVRDKNLFSCQYQMKLEYMTQSTLFLAQAAKLLFFKKHRFTTPLRSITVRAIDLVPEDTPQQLNLFAGYDIQRLHSYDWKAFKAERNYRYWNLEQDSISEVAADDPPEIVQNVEQLMDCIEDERLYKVLKETDGQTLQILLYRMKGYSIKEIEQIMSIDDAAIKMRISRLRKKLKNIF